MSRYVLVILFSLLFASAFCQADSKVDNFSAGLREQVVKFFRLYPQESAFLVTDNVAYTPGDIIWYKLYLWNDGEASFKVSNTAYVVIRNEAGNIIETQRILIAHSEGHGDITLPESLAGGVYSLEVYTNWMLNFSDKPMVSKALWVSDGKQRLTTHQPLARKVIIMPEGGHLAGKGALNKIAVFSGAYGRQGFTFELVDSTGKSVYNKKFNTNYAIVSVGISVPGTYTARLCVPGASRCFEESLPVSEDAVIKLHEDQTSKRVRVDLNNTPYQNRSLLVLTDNDVLEVIHLSPVMHQQPFELQSENYPEGPVHLAVVNDKKEIESYRALYNIPAASEQDPGKKYVTPASSGSSIQAQLQKFSASGEKMSAFVVPGNMSLEPFFLKYAAIDPGYSVNDVMLFSEFRLQPILIKHLNAVSVPITHSTYTPLKQTKNNISPVAPTGFNPLLMLLSGFDNPEKIDSAIVFKKAVARINATYYSKPHYNNEKIPADKTYIPAEYPSMKTAIEFLRQAIPFLKFNNQSDNNRAQLLFSNLKGHKSLYEGKPAFLLNGYRLTNVDALKDIPLTEIASIEVLYDPKTIVGSNMRDLFPYGCVAIYTTNPALPVVKSITANSTFFAGGISWPHAFDDPIHASVTADDRWPSFKCLYYWHPLWNRPGKNALVLAGIPALKPPGYALIAMSLSQVKQKRVLKLMID